MYITFDAQYPSIMREIRCPLCGVVVTSLVALGPEVDRTVEVVGEKTILRIYYLSGLVQTEHAGPGRTFVLPGNVAMSLPVCKQCHTKPLSPQEFRGLAEEVLATEAAAVERGVGASLPESVVARLRDELRASPSEGVIRET